ncbi:MAG TPA: 4Fe-4S binding protein [Thermosulfurimonas dismutans]|uniref:4Fe-4S binding protein n=1 Tax=Thermosulfurimonas dismutans TaxID=999894 RepID=A0A7C3GQK7_9BACT|nr:4Fe-4S binding protein [Thermosulfurimonas dismutans]
MKRRPFFQFLSAVWANSYLGFFLHGGIYTGRLKNLCFPGLNCYSCPLAVMACPLGILQHVMASLRALPRVALEAGLYALGTLLLYGLLLGRFVCGWICPFGFLQEWLYRLPGPKIILPRGWRYLKWGFLLVLVLFLPLALRGPTGYGEVWFCRIFCPAGTLEAALPNLLTEPGLRALVGLLFYWKLTVLVLVLLGVILYHRLFCKLFCPLGLIYGFFNRIGLFRLRWEERKCVLCGLCEEVCPMELKIPRELNSVECIRCLNCLNTCPARAISLERSLGLEPELDRIPVSVTEKRNAS